MILPLHRVSEKTIHFKSINSKIKVTVKMGYGFRNTDNLIALLMLRCSDAKPQLPWNQSAPIRKAA